MMWNWLIKRFSRNTQSRRRRVEVDIPFEQHSYRKTSADLQPNMAVVDKRKKAS
ncbi:MULTISPECIES: hypothetical protein [Shewanella]|uniref:hypothetical protein n=2 Tax=Shewanellaceae TaxID=267890 RepID=UPI000ABEFB40|nr:MULTISPECIES: hypothetical protein [Shewanella]